ncbi:response regulator [Magnetospirillum sp. ME-1]|uniref:response regulator n=1 Tax=Magnetospirillum sp. ME-1 TaxID=1639348 RepID=UPI000A195A6E|nr:response regulator [Magnetospirillum sp. ME-1]
MGRSAEVLLVEDDDSYTRLVLFIFELMEYSCTIDTAANGVEAISKLGERFSSGENFYDIVITDINMAFIDGIELTKYIKSFYSNMNIPVVIMSSHDEFEVCAQVQSAGADRFIQKPPCIDELLKSLSSAIFDFVVLKNNEINLAQNE